MHVSRFTVRDLYILMGRDVVLVDEVPAGNVVGIAHLEDHVLKSATVASTLACPAFRPMNLAASPIVHVAIEPVHASDMPALVRGMKLLNQADPCVEVFVQETGEHTLSTAGEIHLQKCITDLQDTYARVELSVSSPIVPFRETIIHPPKVDMVNEAISSENEVKLMVTNPVVEGIINIQTANKSCTIQIQAKPLPPEVTRLLEKNTHLLKALNLLNTSSAKLDEVKLNKETVTQLKELKAKVHQAFTTETDSSWENAVDSIWSFGPRNTGTNVLLNGLASYDRPSIWNALEGNGTKLLLREYDNSIISGFQVASLSGPLCEEPMHGVCFILQGWSYNREEGGDPDSKEETADATTLARPMDTYGPFSGQLISTMKEGCRRAFLAQPARLMAAMYTCNILATAEVLGKLYAVLGRRNGRVIAEEMKEGSAVFTIQALVPVAESFGFAEEIRKKTSGLASPQLIFSHWEVSVVVSPFTRYFSKCLTILQQWSYYISEQNARFYHDLLYGCAHGQYLLYICVGNTE